MADQGSITIVRRDDAPTVTLAGEIDVYVVKGVPLIELEACRTDGPVAADLGDVTFLDSIGIGFLLQLRDYGSHVRLEHADERTRTVLHLAGVEHLFSYDDHTPAG